MKKVLLVLLLASCSIAGDKSKSGPAVSVGLGNLYGGLGACFEYQVRLRPLLMITPFGSLGFATPIYGGDMVLGPGFCLGVNVEVGRLHRLFMGPSFGAQYLAYDVDPQGHVSNINTVAGPAFTLGYKGTARFGLMWQIFGGVCYPVNDVRSSIRPGPAPVFGLGIGYKF